MQLRKLFVILLLCLLPFSAAKPQDSQTVQLEILWFSDSREDIILRQQLDAFEREHGNITVEINLQSDAGTANDILNDAEETGDFPDVSRTTVPTAYKEHLLNLRPYLENAEDWDENFDEGYLNSLRSGEQDNGLYGYPADITISAPFINRTLWEEAGVPVPSDVKDAVTWEEWVTAAAEVQAALTTDDRNVFALAMDRSGHRFWGPSLSLCARYISADEEIILDTPGFRRAAQMIQDWHNNGLVPVEVWEGDSDTLVPPDEFFIDSQVAFYFSGNWQLDKFDREINDFEWEVVPNPVGPCGQTGMIGGTTVVAFEATDHPEEVGQLFSFLTQYDNLAAFYQENLLLPGYRAMNDEGLEYPDLSDELSRFQGEINRASPAAYELQYYPDSAEIHLTIRDALITMLRDNLTVSETVQIIEQELGIE